MFLLVYLKSDPNTPLGYLEGIIRLTKWNHEYGTLVAEVEKLCSNTPVPGGGTVLMNAFESISSDILKINKFLIEVTCRPNTVKFYNKCGYNPIIGEDGCLSDDDYSITESYWKMSR